MFNSDQALLDSTVTYTDFVFPVNVQVVTAALDNSGHEVFLASGEIVPYYAFHVDSYSTDSINGIEFAKALSKAFPVGKWPFGGFKVTRHSSGVGYIPDQISFSFEPNKTVAYDRIGFPRGTAHVVTTLRGKVPIAEDYPAFFSPPHEPRSYLPQANYANLDTPNPDFLDQNDTNWEPAPVDPNLNQDYLARKGHIFRAAVSLSERYGNLVPLPSFAGIMGSYRPPSDFSDGTFIDPPIFAPAGFFTKWRVWNRVTNTEVISPQNVDAGTGQLLGWDNSFDLKINLQSNGEEVAINAEVVQVSPDGVCWPPNDAFIVKQYSC